jgi:hypothetical protein
LFVDSETSRTDINSVLIALERDQSLPLLTIGEWDFSVGPYWRGLRPRSALSVLSTMT